MRKIPGLFKSPSHGQSFSFNCSIPLLSRWQESGEHQSDAPVVRTAVRRVGLLDIRMEDYFQLQSTNDDRTITRGNPYKLFVNYCRANVRKNFFSEHVVKVWNSLPPTVVNFPHYHHSEILFTKLISVYTRNISSSQLCCWFYIHFNYLIVYHVIILYFSVLLPILFYYALCIWIVWFLPACKWLFMHFVVDA